MVTLAPRLQDCYCSCYAILYVLGAGDAFPFGHTHFRVVSVSIAKDRCAIGTVAPVEWDVRGLAS